MRRDMEESAFLDRMATMKRKVKKQDISDEDYEEMLLNGK